MGVARYVTTAYRSLLVNPADCVFIAPLSSDCMIVEGDMARSALNGGTRPVGVSWHEAQVAAAGWALAFEPRTPADAGDAQRAL